MGTKLTANNGRVAFQPGIKMDLIAFVQWARAQLRCGRDSQLRAFLIEDRIQLLQDLTTFQKFEKRSTLLASRAKPKQFTEEVEFVD